MKNRGILTIGVLSILVFISTSCSSLRPTELYQPDINHFIIPTIGVITTANIGDTLLIEGDIKELPAIVTDETIWDSTYFPIGEYLYIGKNENISFYENDSNLKNSRNTSYFQILEDETGVYIQPQIEKFYLTQDEYIKTNVTEKTYNNFKQSLIYTGNQGNILNFTYREFLQDMARSAFTVDATYDLSKGNIIKFKNATIQILAATNQDITYKILAGFTQ